MFDETNWRISSWNGDTVSGTLVVGLGAGTLEIGLSHGSQSHRLNCAGVMGGMGIGGSVRNVAPSSSSLGFQTPSRTQWGTLYKNTLAVHGDLTLDLLRTSYILATGVELPILDEGVSGYVVIFASGRATAASIVAGLGGLLAPIITGATCRAITFIGAPARGIPGASAVGYRYRVLGGS